MQADSNGFAGGEGPGIGNFGSRTTGRGVPGNVSRVARAALAQVVLLLILVSFQAGFAGADDPAAPAFYTVQPGDTLWSIASRFLDEPGHWPELLQLNPQLADAGALQVGQVLLLTRGIDAATRAKVLPVAKLSPQVRASTHERIPLVIPPHAIRPFLSDPQVLNERDALYAGQVIAGVDGNNLLGQFSRFFAERLPPSLNGLYQVYRPGEAFIDPVSSELLGVAARHLGTARLLVADTRGRNYDQIAKLEMLSSTEEAGPGDRLIPKNAEIGLPSLYPQRPRQAVAGHIVSTLGNINELSLMSVVVVSVGSADGLQVGDMLNILRPEKTTVTSVEIVRPAFAGNSCRPSIAESKIVHTRILCGAQSWLGLNLAKFQSAGSGFSPYRPAYLRGEFNTLPEDVSGQLIVFRVFRRVSYALVLESIRALHRNDRVVSPGV